MLSLALLAVGVACLGWDYSQARRMSSPERARARQRSRRMLRTWEQNLTLVLAVSAAVFASQGHWLPCLAAIAGLAICIPFYIRKHRAMRRE